MADADADADAQATAGYWTFNEEGDFEYRDPDTDALIEVVPFAKARSLAAFFLWQVIESYGAAEEQEQKGEGEG